MEAHLKDASRAALLDVVEALKRPLRDSPIIISRQAFDSLCKDLGLDPEEVLREGEKARPAL